MAAVLRQLGDTTGATEESQRGTELAKRQTGLQAAVFATNSGKRLRGVGDLGNAISQFQSAIAAAPDYAPAHYELAFALRQQGKQKEAREEFETAHRLNAQLEIPEF